MVQEKLLGGLVGACSAAGFRTTERKGKFKWLTLSPMTGVSG